MRSLTAGMMPQTRTLPRALDDKKFGVTDVLAGCEVARLDATPDGHALCAAIPTQTTIAFCSGDNISAEECQLAGRRDRTL